MSSVRWEGLSLDCRRSDDFHENRKTEIGAEPSAPPVSYEALVFARRLGVALTNKAAEAESICNAINIDLI